MKSKAYSDYRLLTTKRLESLQIILDDPNVSKGMKSIAIKETKNQMKEDLDAIFKIMVD